MKIFRIVGRFAFFSLALLAFAPPAKASGVMPKGIILDFNLQRTGGGLIPNRTIYPLYVPLGDLKLIPEYQIRVLNLDRGQSLKIPHTALLDPDGGEWDVSIRIFAKTNGIVLTQANEDVGYILYLEDGIIHASVNVGSTLVSIVEDPRSGQTYCLNRWVSIDLRIKPDMVLMNVNRKRAAIAFLPTPLKGKNMHVRIGSLDKLPEPLKYLPISPLGFSGAIRSFRIVRQ